MLAGRGRDEIEALYRAREPYYRQADLTVDTTSINADQVVSKLLLALRDRSPSTLSPLGRGPQGKPPPEARRAYQRIPSVSEEGK
jgi:hypothetical protein